MLAGWDLPQGMQAVADLGAGEFAQVAVDIFQQVGEVLAPQFGDGDRRAILRQFIVPGVGVAVVATREP